LTAVLLPAAAAADLPKRLAVGAELTPYDRVTFYSFGEQGYVDYPILEDSS
jgi:N-ethylmaleimide reductase